jgi:hypothetical protein
MTTPIITTAQAGALAAKAALRLGVPASVWSGADPESQQSAVEAATDDLYAEPGVQLYGRTSDGAVQLAAAIQALYLLDLQGDANAQERRRLQDQGVTGVQSGKVREDYRPGGSGLCAAARQILRRYRGAVSMA